MNKQDIKILEEENIFQGFFSVKRYLLKHKLFKGGWSRVLHREVVARRNAAGVLLYDPKLDKVLMIEQFRVGAMNDEGSPWIMEVVAGLAEEGESTEALVIREAREEAGVEIESLMPITEYWTSPGGSTERVALYCGKIDASNAGGIHGLEEEGEDIRAQVMDTKEAFNDVKENKINNAMAIIALMWLELNKTSVCKEWEDN